MNGSTIAALGIAVIGLGTCGAAAVILPRRDRAAVALSASLVVCVSLVLLAAGRPSARVLDVALLAGAAGPLATVAVAARGRGLFPGGRHRR